MSLNAGKNGVRHVYQYRYNVCNILTEHMRNCTVSSCTQIKEYEWIPCTLSA